MMDRTQLRLVQGSKGGKRRDRGPRALKNKQQPNLTVIDCRPNLYDCLKRDNAARPARFGRRRRWRAILKFFT